MHKLVCAIFDNGTIHEKCEETVVILICKKGDKTDCKNYRGISLRPTGYKVLCNVLLARLTPHAKEITGDYPCRFQRNRSTSDQIFTLRQHLEKSCEFNRIVRQHSIDFGRAYDTVQSTEIYRILIQLGIQKKLIELIQACLSGNRRTGKVGNHTLETFEINGGLKQGDALALLLINVIEQLKQLTCK